MRHYTDFYPNTYVNNYANYNDRYFLLPFLGGALIGGAAVGLTRPRPIYNVAPNPGYGRPPYVPNAPYYNNSYSYYYPVYPRPY